MDSAKILYERIGGAPVLEAAVIDFYCRVIDDQDLAPFFSGLNIVDVMKKQRDFMTVAFGAGQVYTGKTLRVAHAPLVKRGLSDVHFDRVKEHLQTTLKNMGIKPELVGECLAIVEQTRKDVLNR